MERRLLLAIVLMIAVIIGVNILFPPEPPPPREPAEPEVAERVDTPVAERPPPADREVLPELPPDTLPEEIRPPPEEPVLAAPDPAAPDTILVSGPFWQHRLTSRGAALLGTRLLRYLSYAPEDAEEQRVELVRPGDFLFGWRLAIGGDTVDLRHREFEPSATSLELAPGERDSLVFEHRIPTADPALELRFVVVYRFAADDYLLDVEGRLEGLGPRGFVVLTSLGRGLRMNEANPSDDFGQLSYVTRGRDGGIQSGRLDDVGPEERRAAPGGPFSWVAVKNKYFVAAYISEPGSPGFAGLLLRGTPEEHAAELEAALPVPAGQEVFRFQAFLGPQDYSRMAAVGQDLEHVNPYGWRWLRPIIRPLVGLVMVVLVWMHETFALGYGWVLIVFGILMRVVLFPLYQKSMRAQMAQMQVQPLIKDLQKKYKDEPQKMQQEMMRLYREHNINPLAGCLPMLLPFPVLITLFFVFQNTIEFRGVPFLWLPDLSLKDPIYVIPVLMGVSMFLLQWIGQRGIEANPQLKMMMWAMPVVFTVIFLNFPSGLNLYYATSNFASLPQQLYLSGERRKAYTARKEKEVEVEEAAAEAEAEPGRGPPRAKAKGKAKAKRKGRRGGAL